MDDLEDDDVKSLSSSIGEELSVEELEEEEVERECTAVEEVSTKHLTAKNLQELFKMFNSTMDYMEDIDPNVEWAGITRCKMTALMAQYEQLLFGKRRDASQVKLGTFFRRPHFGEPRPGTSQDFLSCSSTTIFRPAPSPSILAIAATASNSLLDARNPDVI